jgi:hypothetical protein
MGMLTNLLPAGAQGAVQFAKNLARFITDSGLQVYFTISLDPVPVQLSSPEGWRQALASTGNEIVSSISAAGFKKCSGLAENVEQAAFIPVNGMLPVRVNTTVQPGTVSLTGGVAFSEQLFNWYRDCRDWRPGLADCRRDVTILQLKPIGGVGGFSGAGIINAVTSLARLEVDRWTLPSCTCISYTGPEWNSTGNEVSTVSISLTSNGLLYKPYSAQTVNEIANIIKNFGLLGM